MSRSAVIQAKGKPDAEHVIPNEILGRQRILRYGKTRVGLNGPSKSARVIAVTTVDPRQRTRSGVGVGSTEAAVRNGLRGEHCSGAAVRHCLIGVLRPGRRVTDFTISGPARRVTRVTVAIVID